ncbi:MAG: signal peptide peptidase SppA [Desulfovibrio sp.]|nr:signal peptide peptidase SppA [Desulfovibrio sp.]
MTDISCEKTETQHYGINVPDEVWKSLIKALEKKPFYKRFSFLFLLFLFLIVIFSLFFDDEDKDDSLKNKSNSLAIINVKGIILDTTDQLKWIRKIEHADSIKGVLLRIDSPGGGASASQEFYEALKRLASKKPLVVSMGSVAASGGLMIAMAGERIFANAASITGSIGVRMDIPQVKGLLDKLGLGQETLVTGPYKDAGSSTRPMTEEERAYLQSILNDLHTQFMEIIAKSRNLSLDTVKKIATGRVFTGKEAQTLGLVDELGSQEDAHAWLSKKTGVPIEKKLITKPKSQKWYEELFLSIVEDCVSQLLHEESHSAPCFLY